jgi:hypothetical protein
MSENFFSDNPDLQFRLAQIDLREALEFKETGYAQAAEYPARRATTPMPRTTTPSSSG